MKAIILAAGKGARLKKYHNLPKGLLKFGKNKITPTRTVEGSIAFFLSIFMVTLFILLGYNGKFELSIFIVSFLMGTLGALFDLIPLKLDDNMTIPLFTSATLWIICTVFGIYI